MNKVILMLLAITLSGCTYQWKTQDAVTPSTYEGESYRKANSIGKLRRIALMPVELQFYKGHMVPLKDSEIDTAELESRREQFRDLCIDYLTESKGYEVIPVPDNDALLGDWMTGKGEEQDPMVVTSIGNSLEVDGLMVIEIQEERLGSDFTETMQLTVNMLLLNIPMFAQIGSPDIRVWVYETRSGKPVWSRKAAVALMENSHPDQILRDFTNIFSVMENALPEQLIE